MTITRRDCPGPGLERERRALQMFNGTARMHLVDGDTLVLASRDGAARLIL